jgi:hypothetical protein
MGVMSLVRRHARAFEAMLLQLACLGVGLMVGLDVGASTATQGVPVGYPRVQTWAFVGEQVIVSPTWYEMMTATLRGLWVVAILLMILAVVQLLDERADEVCAPTDGEGEPAE